MRPLSSYIYLSVPIPSCPRSLSPSPSTASSNENTEPEMLRKATSILTSQKSKQFHLVEVSPTDGQQPAHRKPSKKRSLGGLLSRASGRHQNTPSPSASGLEFPSSEPVSPTTSPSKTKDQTTKLVKARQIPRRSKRSIPKWEVSQDQDNIPSTIFSSRSSYIQGYSPMSLENDLQTSELLKAFYPSSSPTFYEFSPANVPRNVLDLGCGQRGTWITEAATHWRAHHTRVTGFDVAEPELGTADPILHNNMRYILGDFLDQLPFDNQSFDFVRMANLGLCIPHSDWTKVIEEVYRVLRPGGVLEVIDDELLWPYLRSLPTSSVGFKSFQSSSFEDDDDDDDDDYDDNYDDDDDESIILKPTPTHALQCNAYEEFDRNVSLSRAMEEIFEKMMWFKHHIHPRPHQFIQGLLANVFGESNVDHPRVFKVAFPPAAPGIDEKDTKGDKTGFGSFFTKDWKSNLPAATSNPNILDTTMPSTIPEVIPSKAAQRLLGSSFPTRLGDKREVPALLMYAGKGPVNDGPQHSARFVSMGPSQMETWICKNLHLLLCCKNALADFIHEVQEGDNVMTDEEISSAIWAYECFRRTRFNLPETLNELKMEEHEDTQMSSSYRLSKESNDSGYSSLYSRNSNSSKMYTDNTSQEPEDHTCVRVIRVFLGIKPRVLE